MITWTEVKDKLPEVEPEESVDVLISDGIQVYTANYGGATPWFFDDDTGEDLDRLNITHWSYANPPKEGE